MNIEFSEEQELIRSTAKNFVSNECPTTLVKEIIDSKQGYSEDIWNKMAELGWIGLMIPEEYGGIGGNLLDFILIMEEIGSICLPSPFLHTAVLSALPIIKSGTDEQKQEFLPKIAEGKIILTLALTETSADWGPTSINVRAVANDDKYIINGTKMFIEHAEIADFFLCVARTKDRTDNIDGITLFLVHAKSSGIKCTPFKSMGGDRQSEVVFNNVEVSANNIIGKLHEGWPIVKTALENGAIAKCAEMIGGCQKVLDMTANYVKEREAYGRSIGSFQVVQHYCVDMLTYLNTSRNITYEIAWRISEGIATAKQIAAAKAWTSDAYIRTTKLGAHLHGAIGYTKEYDMGLYYRAAKASQLVFGDSDFQREIIANELGL